ncbi:MAG TPA: hypothetical protein VFW40_01135 [Capsulimonadaceae bacterium]|nr:hypothetical protein [Capsulimonadaceae bacterium]
MRKTLCALMLIALYAASMGAASASHRHRHHSRPSEQAAPLDLSPIDVEPYVLPIPTDPKQASFLKKMNLENGVQVKATRWIERPQVESRDLFVLQITQSLEGGFDSVNMYDKGVASWGIMQWSAHEGSLAHALIYIKRRLLVTRQAKVWQALFVANGMDVDSDGLILYGKPVRDAASARLAFRGTSKIGVYDPNLTNHWANVLARAGRQPAIQALQVEYASHIVEAVLQKRLAGLPYHENGRAGVTAADLAEGDPYVEALVFALWTNNPRHAFEYIENAARAARSVSVSDDPDYWASGTFNDALLRLCLNSRFGNWQQRAQMIEARAQDVHTAPASSLTPFEAGYQTQLAERKARQYVEMASRHKIEPRGMSPTMELAAIKEANNAATAYEKRAKDLAPTSEAKERVNTQQSISPSTIHLPPAAIPEDLRSLQRTIAPGGEQSATAFPLQIAPP